MMVSTKKCRISKCVIGTIDIYETIYSNIMIIVRQWLLIGQVDNVVLELWLFACTVAGSPSGQKRGDAMFHVECKNGYLYPRMGL